MFEGTYVVCVCACVCAFVGVFVGVCVLASADVRTNNNDFIDTLASEVRLCSVVFTITGSDTMKGLIQH